MFKLTRPKKYSHICSSCAKKFDNPEELTVVDICTEGDGSPSTICAGAFCDECLRVLRGEIKKHLGE